jgi:predicted GNAT family N-acyltransferase
MGSYEIRRVAGDATLADAHAVRRAVFVEEQGVPAELELDGLDERASQFVAYDSGGRPVGTARLRTPKAKQGKPERVAVRDSHRGEGLGERLMAAVEAAAREQGCDRLVLHAQTTVEAFYEQLGYETASGVFEEAGIPHVRMEKELEF